MISKKRIFISHASKDNNIARIIADELERRGCSVWNDEQNLDFGRFRQKRDESFSACQAVMILLSEGVLRSLWLNREIDAALALKARTEDVLIIPALVGPCVVPPLLSGYKCLNFMHGSDYEAEIDLFMCMFDQKDDSLPPPTSAASPMSSRIESLPQYSSGSNIINGNISGRNINIHQGDSFSINHSHNPSIARAEHKDDSPDHFVALVDELSRNVKDGRSVDTLSLERFLSAMSDINARSIPLPPQLIQKVRVLCKQLGLITLI